MAKLIKMTKDIVPVIKKELSPIVSEALAIKVKTADDMPVATEVLSRLNKLNDRITEEKEKITKPLNEALKVERARWAPIEKHNKEGIEHLRTEIGNYQTAEYKRKQEAEAKIAADLASGKIKKIETATKRMSKIESAPDKVVADSGSLTFREDKVFKITNNKLIPDEYWVIDEDKLLEALKAGVVVPGAELDVKLVPINRR